MKKIPKQKFIVKLKQTELKEKYNFLRMGGSRDGHGVYIEMSMMQIQRWAWG